jgi:mannose-6-phosphate isomerase
MQSGTREGTDQEDRQVLRRNLLKLQPQYRERVWGGQRLRRSDPPIGEAWIAMGDSVVAEGPFAGRRVCDLSADFGEELLGSRVSRRFGTRFPLLAKILDCADWLSVQVHPNDEQARRMVGPDEFGKTEAWYFLETEPGAEILMGVRPGVNRFLLERAIRTGTVADVAERVQVEAGEAVLIPAGTLHALGPGLLLYEIQQESDTTYRAFDWNRPQTGTRKLHIEESVAVTTTDGPQPFSRPTIGGSDGTADAVESAYFDVDLVAVAAMSLTLDTRGRSFYLLTCIENCAEVELDGQIARIDLFETLLVPGAAGQFTVRSADGSARLLATSVPE